MNNHAEQRSVRWSGRTGLLLGHGVPARAGTAWDLYPGGEGEMVVGNCSAEASLLVIDACAPMMREGEAFRLWRRGGFHAACATVAQDDTPEAAFRRVAWWCGRIARHGDELLLATSVADLYRARAEGKLAVIFHFQNTVPFDLDLDLVWGFAQAGVRMVQLTYNRRNFVGDGCCEPSDAGLSAFGRRLIRELNAAGIVVDLSHTGVRTTLEAMGVSSAPVVFSHSNARALCDSPRNLTDEQIRELARVGGVIGLNAFPAFVAPGGSPSLEDLLRHLDYICDLVGADHVGLGLDFALITEADYRRYVQTGEWSAEAYPPPPYQYALPDPSALPVLRDGLVRRGYDEEHIAKFLGGNFLRVFQSVWGGGTG